MTFTGTMANINAALGGLTYQPNLNFNGSDTLTILTSDLGNTGSGGPKFDTDTVAITVAAVNDAPVNTVPGTQTTRRTRPRSSPPPTATCSRSATWMPPACRSP